MRLFYAALFCLVVVGAFWSGYAVGFITCRDMNCTTIENLRVDSTRPVEA